MTAATITSAFVRSGKSFRAAFERGYEAYCRNAERKKAVCALSELDDRVLRDMGFDLSEIISVTHANPDERRIHYAGR